MTDAVWRPLSVENNEENTAEYDALHEGIPPWMEKAFWDWVTFSFFTKNHYNEAVLDKILVLQMGMRLQIVLPKLPSGLGPMKDEHLLRKSMQDLGKGLDIADFLLAYEGHGDPDALEWILKNGKSAWTVGIRNGEPGLAKRVVEGVQEAADYVMKESGTAGIKLARAWEALYGLHPNPDLAYSLAIKAVEDAAIPIVSPRNGTATLGTVLRDMRAQEDWDLPMARKDDRTPSGGVLLGMMQMLWTGQHTRHGGQSDLPPLTHEEAVVGVSLAVTVVHWFTTNELVKRSKDRS